MYTTTFYSYKGGVGRTMALANVGYLLAKRGRRVLLVDFDLEAPGLSTYEPFRCAGRHRGVVEYVSEYLETNQSPDVSDFIVPCRIDDTTLWVMPAGEFEAVTYQKKLHGIDWRHLYEDRSGFLFMEDLKEQWRGYDGRGFDYVLIDSRTGHTDVGGICTRQLPDAVVVMFVPTPQNISGLQPIIQGIRREKAPVRLDKVRLHFCPSNVPDLDDEEDILSDLLDSARETLGYQETAGLIQHYESLDLLQQPIYAWSHPKSRLTKQYDELRTSIASGNLEDREGALIVLGSLQTRYREARDRNDEKALDVISQTISNIRSIFPADTEVAWSLAILANIMARPEEELSALDTVISTSGDESLALVRRAMVRATLSDRQGALDDLRQLLQKERITVFETRSALSLLPSLDPENWRSTVLLGLENPGMDALGKNAILMALLDSRESTGLVVDLVEKALKIEPDDRVLRNVHILALISGGHFQRAKEEIASSAEAVLNSKFVPDMFNYAIADWGHSRVIPRQIFERVLASSSSLNEHSDANAHQCFAICHLALGQTADASKEIQLAQKLAEGAADLFSAWRYLTVSSQEMKEDLVEMQRLTNEGRVVHPPQLPYFFSGPNFI